VYRGYLGSAADLDDGFREFLDLLQRHDRRDHGYVIFTSDHGEHFGEHDLLMHGYGIFEEALRIPLMLQGPGIEPSVSAASASLVDLPRTICTLLDVPPAESWSGRSLIESTAPGAVYAFSCPLQGQAYALVLDPPYKLGGKVNEEARAIGEAEVAYQLEQDPQETKNLLELPGADHHRASFHRHRGALRASLVPSGAASSVSIDPAERARLAAAGYVIEDETEDESAEEDPEDADESDSNR